MPADDRASGDRLVRSEADAGVARITLDSPHNRNAM
jgi:hypothetical protein